MPAPLRAVHKYRLEIVNFTQMLPLGENDKIVLIAEQDGFLTLWAEVTIGAEESWRGFCVHGTGQPITPKETHVGSAVVGRFVWHVYEQLG